MRFCFIAFFLRSFSLFLFIPRCLENLKLRFSAKKCTRFGCIRYDDSMARGLLHNALKRETQCALLITLHNTTTWFHMKIVAASATAQRQWREHFGFLDTKIYIYIWMHGNGKFAISICAPSEKMWRQALHPIQTYRLLYCIEFFFVTRFFLFLRYHQTAKNALAIFFKYRARILFRFFFRAEYVIHLNSIILKWYMWRKREWNSGKRSEEY